MRRKLLSIIILIISVSISSDAHLPDSWFFQRLNMGLEWGYTQSVLRTWDYNIISEEGYRIYDQDGELMLHPNASLSAHIGYLLNDHLVLALYGGYAGVGKGNRLLPVQLRMSWFMDPLYVDGCFLYLQGGPAFHIRLQETHTAWMFVSGFGYRLRLNADCSLDLGVGLKYLQDHPVLPNPEGPGYVPAHHIRKNNAGYYALDLTLGFNF